ncbi:MAG: rRNA maturation RNase YbeY [Candidatus Omnitrophica bacterium]|nr:rRNA maturation RNase YbeY [Candidatus Omnitrophota bacterium]
MTVKTPIVEIVNAQKLKKLNLKKIKGYLSKIFKILGISKQVSILFCDNRRIRNLNRKYFKVNCATDVIAFPLEEDDYLGEVIISVEKAAKSCAKYSNTWEKELTLYLVHGVLHLVGYNDIKNSDKVKMQSKECEIMKVLYDS